MIFLFSHWPGLERRNLCHFCRNQSPSRAGARTFPSSASLMSSVSPSLVIAVSSDDSNGLAVVQLATERQNSATRQSAFIIAFCAKLQSEVYIRRAQVAHMLSWVFVYKPRVIDDYLRSGKFRRRSKVAVQLCAREGGHILFGQYIYRNLITHRRSDNYK